MRAHIVTMDTHIVTGHSHRRDGRNPWPPALALPLAPAAHPSYLGPSPNPAGRLSVAGPLRRGTEAVPDRPYSVARLERHGEVLLRSGNRHCERRVPRDFRRP